MHRLGREMRFSLVGRSTGAGSTGPVEKDIRSEASESKQRKAHKLSLLRASAGCPGSDLHCAANGRARFLISDEGQSSKNDHIHLLIHSQRNSYLRGGHVWDVSQLYFYPLRASGVANLWTRRASAMMRQRRLVSGAAGRWWFVWWASGLLLDRVAEKCSRG
jgi:hypothetical protein